MTQSNLPFNKKQGDTHLAVFFIATEESQGTTDGSARTGIICGRKIWHIRP